MEYLEEFFLSFIPLFVAMDVLAVFPIFLSVTSGMSEKKKNRLITNATVTAGILAFVFLISGKFIFSFMGISENDFRIGGGIVLLILSILDLLFSQHEERRSGEGQEVGVVPIGIPLIMGPAALTTIIILVDRHGYIYTVLSMVINLLIVWLVFRQAKLIKKVLGEEGAAAFGKVASLFLAGIAVNMIRVGVTNLINAFNNGA